MRRFLVRWLIHALSLAAAAWWVPGLSFPGNPPGVGQVVAVAALFGVLNALVKPLLQFAACGLYFFTLGLIHFVINALILQLTGWLAPRWLTVQDFSSAFVGALVVSLVGTVLVWLLDPQERVELEQARQLRQVRVLRGSVRGDVIDGE